jgi:hypothetical protein
MTDTDDTAALAAFATHHDYDPEAALTAWGLAGGKERARWRATSDAAVMAADLKSPACRNLRAELGEITRYHDELLDEVLRNAGDGWELDEAADSIAVKYVRHLEAETTRLACAIRDIQITASDALKFAEDREADGDFEDAEPAYSDPPRADPSGHDGYQFPTVAELGGEKFADYPSEGGL